MRLRRSRVLIAALVAAALCLSASAPLAAPLILNEWNAVASGEFLNGGTAGIDGDGNSVDPPSDTYFGRVAGNGGDWMEFVVVADHLDIRGWKLVICEAAVCADELVFSNDAVWSDLRAGTILTVAEDEPTDIFWDGASDWWINVRAHNGGDGTYITASNFPVNHSDWRMYIEDDQGRVVFGPSGEHVAPSPGCDPPQDDVNSGEIVRLEQNPTALIDPCRKSQNDWEDGVISTFGAPNQWNSGFASQHFDDLRTGAPVPDSDGDGIADDADQSGVAGDNRCVGGATAGCDDNCQAIPNASQADVIGPGGADGLGDVCQCGDPTADDAVTSSDLAELRSVIVGLAADVTDPDRCAVHGDATCTLADAVVLARTLQSPSLEPGLEPACPVAAVPADVTDIVFDPDRLLQVEVKIAESDWLLLDSEARDLFDTFGSQWCGTIPWPNPYNFYPAEVTVDGQTFTNVAVRKKGFVGSVLNAPYPSLKIKFDEYVGGQQWNDMDRLTLNNNNQDPAHLKQCVTYDLMRQAGLPAPRCNFAEVRVITTNGGVETEAVHAIYTHVESIKDPFLRRNFGSDAGKLYEGTIADFWPGSFRNVIEPKNPAAGLDWTEVDALTTTLSGSMSDAARLTAIQGLVHVDDFLNHWAMEGLTGHWDGYVDNQNNFWFYVDPGDGLIRFIPWGTDDTLGRGNTLQNRSGDPTHAEPIVPRSALARRLYDMPSVRADFLARLQWLLDNVWDEAYMHAEIDRIEALISPVEGDLTSQLAPIRTWVDAHRAIVQAQIDSPPAGFGGQPQHFCFFNP